MMLDDDTGAALTLANSLATSHFHTATPLSNARSTHAFALLDSQRKPRAVLKRSDNPTKLIPEHHALSVLESCSLTPHVLAKQPGALLLSWLDNAPLPALPTLEHFTTHTATQLGTQLAKIHATPIPQDSQLKLLHDPLPLHQRLLKIATKTCKRARKHLDAADTSRLQHGLSSLRRLLEHTDVHTALAHKSLIHRDLNPENILLDDQGTLLGIVDFERAAAAPAAWDFVKLEWWLFSHLPDTCQRAFLDAYDDISPLPSDSLIDLFALHEALTLLAYFAHAPQPYANQARAYLDSSL